MSRSDSGGVDLLTDGHILGLHRVIWRHIAVTRRAGIGVFFVKDLHSSVRCRKAKSRLSVPAGVPGDDLQRPVPRPQVLLQRLEGPDRQLVVLCKRGNEAVAAIDVGPDGVTGEEVFIVNQIDRVPQV